MKISSHNTNIARSEKAKKVLVIVEPKSNRKLIIDSLSHIEDMDFIEIVMLTSEAKENMEAYRYGVSVYMMKPIKPIVLRKVVETVLYRYMGN